MELKEGAHSRVSMNRGVRGWAWTVAPSGAELARLPHLHMVRAPDHGKWATQPIAFMPGTCCATVARGTRDRQGIPTRVCARVAGQTVKCKHGDDLRLLCKRAAGLRGPRKGLAGEVTLTPLSARTEGGPNTQDLKKEGARHIHSLKEGPEVHPAQWVGRKWVLSTGREWSALDSRTARNQAHAVPHHRGGWLRGWKVEAGGRRLKQPEWTLVAWMAEMGEMEKLKRYQGVQGTMWW